MTTEIVSRLRQLARRAAVVPVGLIAGNGHRRVLTGVEIFFGIITHQAICRSNFTSIKPKFPDLGAAVYGLTWADGC
jgi:hypothetical protein